MPSSSSASKSHARSLRREQTEVERTIWYWLRARRFGGAKFRRQFPIGEYVVDFCCWEQRLVVEIDGGQHGAAMKIHLIDLARTRPLTRAPLPRGEGKFLRAATVLVVVL